MSAFRAAGGGEAANHMHRKVINRGDGTLRAGQRLIDGPLD